MWWLIIHTPDGVHAWPVWGESEAPDEDILNRARVAVGFPSHDQWPFDGSEWDMQLTLGEPHDNLLARATVGHLDDLRKVDDAAVAAHAEARRAEARRERREEIRALAVDLDDVTFAEVVAARAATADAIREA